MINQLIKNNIKNNLVYHASPNEYDILLGDKTKQWSNQVGNVFVTPFKGIATCFIINREEILDKLSQQFGGRFDNLNFGYNIWNNPIEELTEIPETITVTINFPHIKSFSGISEGYLYTIDFNKYKNQCHMFNKNPNSDIEFLIEGNVEYIKCEKIYTNWVCQSNDEDIVRHGMADLRHDPPYILEQIKQKYPRDIYQKLKNDPIHYWRAQTGIQLIHKQPSIEQQQRTWKNWLLMSKWQKYISDKKSIELFGMDNYQHNVQIMNNYNSIISQQLLQTGTNLIVIHPMPNIDDQRELWYNWCRMSDKQKRMSDKKSKQFFNMSNKQHHDFIMFHYWGQPIKNSKFEEIYKMIMQSI